MVAKGSLTAGAGSLGGRLHRKFHAMAMQKTDWRRLNGGRNRQGYAKCGSLHRFPMQTGGLFGPFA